MKLVLLGAASLLLAAPVSSLRAEWFRETVDESLPAGFACSLVLDSADRPHIAYWRQFSPSFPNSFSPYYATKSGAAWQIKEVGSTSTMMFGQYTSIVVGEGGRPAIAYQTSGSLLFYTQMQSDGEWPLSLVHIASNTGTWLSMIWDDINLDTPAPRIASSQGTTLNFLRGMSWNDSAIEMSTSATSPSMDIDSSGVVGIGFINSGNIRYASALQGNTPVPPNTLVFPQNLSATRSAFTFDSNGRSHIFYYDETSATYRHIADELDNNAWTFTPATVSAAGTRAIDFYGCSIAGGPDGSLHAAFLDYATNTLKYARRAQGSSTWAIENVDTAGSTGGYCQIQVDSKGRPKIVYHDITNSRLRYAQRLAALSFKVDGKSKRTTKKKTLAIAGSASDSAVSVEWRVGKKGFRAVGVAASGKWSLTVKGLKPGRNKLQCRAKAVDGSVTSIQTVRIVRK